MGVKEYLNSDEFINTTDAYKDFLFTFAKVQATQEEYLFGYFSNYFKFCCEGYKDRTLIGLSELLKFYMKSDKYTNKDYYAEIRVYKTELSIIFRYRPNNTVGNTIRYTYSKKNGINYTECLMAPINQTEHNGYNTFIQKQKEYIFNLVVNKLEYFIVNEWDRENLTLDDVADCIKVKRDTLDKILESDVIEEFLVNLNVRVDRLVGGKSTNYYLINIE